MEAALTDEIRQALRRHVGGVPTAVTVSALAGGFTGAAVRRVDLQAAGRGWAFVVKSCPPREAAVMGAIAGQGAATFPRLIAAGEDWFVAPFYEGPDLTFHDPAPIPVAQDLARLHAAWESRSPPAGLWTYDTAHVLALHANTLSALAVAATPEALAGRERLAGLDGASPLVRLTDRLPRTLVHGDVHPGNIIAGPDGRFTLIDWGNAAVAPAMLDIANTIPVGEAGWIAYLAAYRAAGGAQSDAAQVLAWRWAKGVSALMYLPWVVQHRPAEAPRLIAQALEADAALAAAAEGPLP